MKRGLSDTENEDDTFEDDESEHRAGSPTQSCHVPDRKRRRGIIEKRRRDRINYSLSELKRLVPAAFEKQGSSKLEKAEILKMTVDHLKMLQSRGGTYGFDTAAVAMDFRSVGFRECAAEVARYLVAIEGLDSHDPLCVRLLSHLHYYPSTASSSASSSSTSVSGHVTNWHPSTTNRPPYAKPVTSLDAPYAKPVTSMVSVYAAPHNRQVEPTSAVPSGSTAFVDYARFDDRTSGYGQFRFPNATSAIPGGAQHGGALVEDPASQGATSVCAGLNSQFLNLDSSAFGYNNNNNNPSSSLSSSSSSSLSSTSSLLQCLRPYRPWGGDLVY